MIELRPVESEVDAGVYLRLRNEIFPRDPVTPAAFAGMRTRPRRIDVVAFLDGEPVGIASCGDHWVDPDGAVAYTNVRVLRAHRRRGVGTALFRRVSEHARGHGRSGLYTVVPEDDGDSLAYLGPRGYERALEMQGVALELGTVAPRSTVVHDLELRRIDETLDQAVYEAALEVERDLQTHEPTATPAFEAWRRRNFPPLVRRDLSFALLDGDTVVAYAILEESPPGVGDHSITGVRRAYRGRGLGRALKEAQIAAAKAAGLRELQATNTVTNTPIRTLNERLGYRQTYLHVHLKGPLL